MGTPSNPLYPALISYMSKRLFGIDAVQIDIREKLSQERIKLEKTCNAFHITYSHIEPGDIGGFEEGDLLRYQHSSRESFLRGAFIRFTDEIRRFPDFYSKEFRDFLDNYKTFSPSYEYRMEESRVVSCAKDFFSR